jgi:hypothetical protein
VIGPNDPGGVYIATPLCTLERVPVDNMTTTASDLEAPSEDAGYRQWKLMVYITSKRDSNGAWKKDSANEGFVELDCGLKLADATAGDLAREQENYFVKRDNGVVEADTTLERLSGRDDVYEYTP